MPQSKHDILQRLQADILRLQGLKPASNASLDIGLRPMVDAFPNSSFPLGAVHEFLCGGNEDAASTGGFITGILSNIMGNRGAALWISSSRTIFPPALKYFGIEPDRFIFIDLRNEKEVFWATEEALKCNALSAVVSEMREIDFTASRRLQLAVEQSRVTGFIIRNNYRKVNTTACAARWKITPLPSRPDEELPGIGFPRWKVELLRMRNGKSGSWTMQWAGRFVADNEPQAIPQFEPKKTG